MGVREVQKRVGRDVCAGDGRGEKNSNNERRTGVIGGESSKKEGRAVCLHLKFEVFHRGRCGR